MSYSRKNPNRDGGGEGGGGGGGLEDTFYLESPMDFLLASQDIWGNIHYVPDKSFLCAEQNNLKEI